MSRRNQDLQPIGRWIPGDFLMANWYGAETERGLIFGGLAIQKLWNGSPKGRRPPTWNITHIGSGHRVCMIEAHQDEAFAIADKIADLGDWTFDGLHGWKNTDPDLFQRVVEFAVCTPPILLSGTGCSEAVAREIAYARSA